MNISITGTRIGMSLAQRAYMRDILCNVTLLAHGGSSGVDHQCHMLFNRPQDTEVYPSNLEQHNRYGRNSLRYLHPIQSPLGRNRLIVSRTPILYAMPRMFYEEKRGGTWATIRYAQKVNRYFVIVWPDGQISVNDTNYPA